MIENGGWIYVLWTLAYLKPLLLFFCVAPVLFPLVMALRAYRRNNSPLIAAAREGLSDAVRNLIRQGADINAASIDGRTPLIHAATHGRTDVVRLLLESGAEIDAKSRSGGTAMSVAASKGHANIVDLIQEHKKLKVGPQPNS